MEITFRFKTTGTQRVYAVLKIVLKLVFIGLLSSRQFKWVRCFRPIKLNIL